MRIYRTVKNVIKVIRKIEEMKKLKFSRTKSKYMVVESGKDNENNVYKGRN